MSGNGYGNHRSSTDQVMAEHDALPPSLRYLSCYSIAKWTAASFTDVYEACRRAGYTHARAVAKTAAAIAAEEARDTRKAYGPGHPEAPPLPPRKPRK